MDASGKIGDQPAKKIRVGQTTAQLFAGGTSEVPDLAVKYANPEPNIDKEIPPKTAQASANGDQPGMKAEKDDSANAGQTTAPMQEDPAVASNKDAAAVADPSVKTYYSRERRIKDREDSGELGARYVWNDGLPESGRLLVGLKNVFSLCLPNMPKTYISRLVFDRRHRSVVILLKGTRVIGGITYRPFHDRQFAEIAFCAVAQTLQVSGFGTRLMNWTKQFARDVDSCEYFLTYADNAAVGYFSKQGFTKALTMPRDRWGGYIKDYDGSTLMECYIHPTLPFTALPEMIKEQRAALDAAVRRHSTAHIVHAGLDWDSLLSLGAIPRVDEIPGVKEAGWREATSNIPGSATLYQINQEWLPPTPENLHSLQERLLSRLEAEEELIGPFLEPVDPVLVPDYYAVIKDPIDISTVRARLAGGRFYITLEIFVADIMRIFSNAKNYNKAETVFYKAAHKLAVMFQRWLDDVVKWEVPEGIPALAAPQQMASK